MLDSKQHMTLFLSCGFPGHDSDWSAGRWRPARASLSLKSTASRAKARDLTRKGDSPPVPLGRPSGTHRPGSRRLAGRKGCQARRASREAASSGIKDVPRTWAGRQPGTPGGRAPTAQEPTPASTGKISPEPTCRGSHSRLAPSHSPAPRPPRHRRRPLRPRPQSPRVASLSESPPRAPRHKKKGIPGPTARRLRALTSSILPPAAISRRRRPKPWPAQPLHLDLHSSTPR
nr:translation initiation factor IF-2-like isoform X2 [Gorilla gorilla gorilla]